MFVKCNFFPTVLFVSESWLSLNYLNMDLVYILVPSPWLCECIIERSHKNYHVIFVFCTRVFLDCGTIVVCQQHDIDEFHSGVLW